MLEIRFDPTFVEEAVFLEVSRLTNAGHRRVVSSFHREREAVYQLADGQQRDAAFRQLAHRYFQTLGFSELFAERLAEFSSLSSRVDLAIIRRVWRRKDEQVELYFNHTGAVQPTRHASTVLVIGLQPARCLDRERLTAFLRHELMHVADMLAPAFAYDPHPALGGENEPEQELIRVRFRALWDVWVHARCAQRGWQTLLDDAARRREVARAFALLNPADRDALVAAVRREDRWTQEELLALARTARVAVTA